MHPHAFESSPLPPVSPLRLSDQLISLAEQADRSGYTKAARHLVDLAFKVLDEKPH
jgi:hypothetical protein